MPAYLPLNFRADIESPCSADPPISLSAPMVLVEDFKGGMYVTYSYAGPMMLRIVEVCWQPCH